MPFTKSDEPTVLWTALSGELCLSLMKITNIYVIIVLFTSHLDNKNRNLLCKLYNGCCYVKH